MEEGDSISGTVSDGSYEEDRHGFEGVVERVGEFGGRRQAVVGDVEWSTRRTRDRFKIAESPERGDIPASVSAYEGSKLPVEGEDVSIGLVSALYVDS